MPVFNPRPTLLSLASALVSATRRHIAHWAEVSMDDNSKHSSMMRPNTFFIRIYNKVKS